MKRSVQLAVVAASAAAIAGLSAAPGDAAAGVVPGFTQPSSGAVSITSGTSEINVMVINRKDADNCTVTATRPDGAGTKTLTRTVTLNALNQYTGIANFSGLLDKRTYTVSGTCAGTKVVAGEDGADDTTEKVTTNLLGGSNKVAVTVDASKNTQYAQCLQIVKGIAWDLGLRGAPMQTVMSLAGTFCPR